jgi:hypothetical protein
VLSPDDITIELPNDVIPSLGGRDVDVPVTVFNETERTGKVRVEHTSDIISGPSVSTVTLDGGDSASAGRSYTIPEEPGVESYTGEVVIEAVPSGEELAQQEYTVDVTLDAGEITANVVENGLNDVVSGKEYTAELVIQNETNHPGRLRVVHDYIGEDGDEKTTEQIVTLDAGGRKTISETQPGPFRFDADGFTHSFEVYSHPDGGELAIVDYDVDVTTPRFGVEGTLEPESIVTPFSNFDLGLSVANFGDATGDLYVEIGGVVLADGESVPPESSRSYSASFEAPSSPTSFSYVVRNQTLDRESDSGEFFIDVEEEEGEPEPPETPDQPGSGRPSPPTPGDGDGEDGEPYDGVFTYLDPLGLFGTSKQFDLSDGD